MTLPARLADLFPREADLPAEHVPAELPLEQREYLVDGALRRWEGPRQEVLSPVCLRAGDAVAPQRLGAYPLLGRREAMAALAAARRAWDEGRGRWPTLPVAARIEHVERFALRMVEHRDTIVRLLMWEIGKTLPDARKEFDRTVDYIRDTVDALKDLDRVSSRFLIEDGILAQVRRAPLGAVLCMGPYNYPLNETFTTLIPALIMGNCVVFKPPRLGVLLHRPLLEAFRDCFPPGVVNTVTGDGREVAGPLMASGGVDALAFIGSSRVADLLKSQHPRPHRLRSVLGLEAKNPAVVLADADLELAAAECLLGALSFNGQRCTALKILFVHESRLDEMLERLAAGIAELRAGMPWQEGVRLTPLPERAAVDYQASLLADAVAKGAAVVNPRGGEACATYIHPALVHPVASGMRLYAEEQFGPLVPVLPFRDAAEPVRFVVESNYGQQVSLFGEDPERMARLIDPLVNQVCRVNLNSQCQRGPDTFPFTGRKDSAEGTLSVSDALRVFTIRTLVAAKGTPANKALVTGILRERRSDFLSTDFLL
ncbi:MAG: NADP-dependent glyceraldehyde-3-phosphate dehydrogenase [Candidatus Krumholzibacteriota bacterium]|nr:NADP-dependent glyceraldehyde-3-phosphate dehydrogenase [Candidatus Krumholzibacteriota bacterium]